MRRSSTRLASWHDGTLAVTKHWATNSAMLSQRQMSMKEHNMYVKAKKMGYIVALRQEYLL
eukprot:scaffold638876_cov33-Prasinocladus_malaysianus.AAC.1